MQNDISQQMLEIILGMITAVKNNEVSAEMYHTRDNNFILVFDGILQTSCLSIQNEDIIFLFRQFSVIAGLWMNEICFWGGDDCKKCHATNLWRLKRIPILSFSFKQKSFKIYQNK